MNKKVFHISPENTAGVPYNVMAMQKKYGVQTRLLTFYKVPFNFPEDICLDLTIPRSRLAMKWREFKQSNLHKKIKEQNADSLTYMPYFKPANAIEKAYMNRREKSNEGKLLKSLNEMQADSYDIIHFGSGIDYYGDSRLAKRWKMEGKKIVNCYYGDDLRTRGIVKEMDELSDMNLTFEYDHTLRHPNINFLFFPFDESIVYYIEDEKFYSSKKIRIVHSPTHRFIKGTEFVLEAIDKVKKSGRDIDFVLIENEPREIVIELKSSCHIAIDQVGNRGGTGYGINSLETLAMGLPTITDMNGGMDSWLQENPFIIANSNNLAEKITETVDGINNKSISRKNLRDWVIKYHSYESVYKKLNEYYKNYNIF